MAVFCGWSPRPAHHDQLVHRLASFPVVAMLGARQVGKTTLARQLAARWDGPVRHFDLENPDDQADPAASREWRDAFIRTYLERDLPQLGIKLSAITLRRFWTMLAHYHGQTWNGSELARALGVSDKTVSRYLEILEGAFMAFRLPPWHSNLGKREVKSPKVYVADTGILHSCRAGRARRLIHRCATARRRPRAALRMPNQRPLPL